MKYKVVIQIPIVIEVNARGEYDARRKALEEMKKFTFSHGSVSDVVALTHKNPRRIVCGACGEQPKSCLNLPECKEEQRHLRKLRAMSTK